jgi:4-hydroxybenzoate polyprenyltransferase
MVQSLLARSRPRFWLYLAGPVLVGAVYGAGDVGVILSPPIAVLFAFFLLPANLYLYGVNDLFDVDTDAHNPKKGNREVRYRGGRVLPAVVFLSGLLLVPVAWFQPAAAWGPLLGWAVLGTAYSVPPVRLKARPFLDSLSNGLYVLPGIAAYAALAGGLPPGLAIAGAWAWSMAMHTFSAIPDVEPDREAGLETTATALGPEGAYRYCGLLWAGAAIAFGLLDWRLGLALGTYPMLLLVWATAGVEVDRAYWWYPAINALIGGLLTVGGLWRLLHG